MRKNSRWKGSLRGADSKWEAKLRDGVLADCKHHPGHHIQYSIPHHYEPDFLYKDSIFIEAKGRFVDSAEARKYVYIKPEIEKLGMTFVFLFYKPDTPMPQAKRRKDGSKRTMREWADEHGFRWYTEDTIKEVISE